MMTIHFYTIGTFNPRCQHRWQFHGRHRRQRIYLHLSKNERGAQFAQNAWKLWPAPERFDVCIISIKNGLSFSIKAEENKQSAQKSLNDISFAILSNDRVFINNHIFKSIQRTPTALSGDENLKLIYSNATFHAPRADMLVTEKSPGGNLYTSTHDFQPKRFVLRKGSP